ncbi:Splicing factor YJU2 like protein [Verticillium longisporum]|nr:Splicing factor YJU2 like protein [Verticillium longisporum]
MSERKVLTKYFPPDFDPRALTRKRGPKSTGVKTQAVRIMAPFSMKDGDVGIVMLGAGDRLYAVADDFSGLQGKSHALTTHGDGV